MNEEVPAECKHNEPSPLHIWGQVVSLRHLSEEVPAECKHNAARLYSLQVFELIVGVTFESLGRTTCRAKIKRH